jgi:hypothetical protein
MVESAEPKITVKQVFSGMIGAKHKILRDTCKRYFSLVKWDQSQNARPRSLGRWSIVYHTSCAVYESKGDMKRLDVDLTIGLSTKHEDCNIATVIL